MDSETKVRNDFTFCLEPPIEKINCDTSSSLRTTPKISNAGRLSLGLDPSQFLEHLVTLRAQLRKLLGRRETHPPPLRDWDRRRWWWRRSKSIPCGIRHLVRPRIHRLHWSSGLAGKVVLQSRNNWPLPRRDQRRCD